MDGPIFLTSFYFLLIIQKGPLKSLILRENLKLFKLCSNCLESFFFFSLFTAGSSCNPLKYKCSLQSQIPMSFQSIFNIFQTCRFTCLRRVPPTPSWSPWTTLSRCSTGTAPSAGKKTYRRYGTGSFSLPVVDPGPPSYCA